MTLNKLWFMDVQNITVFDYELEIYYILSIISVYIYILEARSGTQTLGLQQH